MEKVLLIVFVLISEFSLAQGKANVGVGDQVILFSGETVEGNKIYIGELYKKNPVVLIVLRGWPGYQCPVCTRQVGGLIADADEFQNLGAAVLMVYPGPSEELVEHANEFREDFKFPSNFYFILDPDYSIINKYGLRWNAPNETAYPSAFVIDKNGEIIFEKISSSHGDRAGNKEIFTVLEQLN